MSALEKIRAERCEWCAKRFPFLENRSGDNTLPRTHRNPDINADAWLPRCAAPSPEAVIEELAGKLEEAKRDGERAEALKQAVLGLTCEISYDSLYSHSQFNPGWHHELRKVESALSAMDAAMSEKREGNA